MERNLKDLKEEYKKLQQEYDLPEFNLLNEDFGIEKAVEVETDFLIREIRKFVAEKFSNYLRFVEVLLQPVNAPLFVYSIVKAYGETEKEKLTQIYKKLAEKEISLIELDVQFNEKKEAEFIKDSYKLWQEIKKETTEILEVIKKNWDNKSKTNDKNYFG